ncbi:MAG: hypothetical protein M1830_009309, partial [Pleopsidium flavum]
MSNKYNTANPLSLRTDYVQSPWRTPYVSTRGVNSGYDDIGSMETRCNAFSATEPASSRTKNLPDVLRAGSPVSQRASKAANILSTTYQPSPRYDAPQSAMPKRPPPRHQSSRSSMDSDDSVSRRLSLPTALQPASETAYRLKDYRVISGSVPMSKFYENPTDHQHLNPVTRSGNLPSRSASIRSIFSGLSSLRSPSSTKSFSWRSPIDDYAIVEEEDGHGLLPKKGRFSIRSFQGDDLGNGVGYDISSFEGPIGLQQISASSATITQMQTQGTLAAEFHQLEAGGKLTGGLGGGMVVGTKLQVNASSSAIATGSSRLAAPESGGLVRGNTIRDVGLREAKERGEIIAIKGIETTIHMVNQHLSITEVNPVIDLSSFGGAGHAGAEIGSYGETFLKMTLADQDKQSYFYPADPDMPNWRPLTMRQPYTILLVLISLGLAGTQEWLYQRSAWYARQNPPSGILEFKSPQDVSPWSFFCWRYLPTIIFVSYGVLWQIVDYQVKRLEPYYQLSKPSGSTAAKSLNVDYLTFYNFLTPFKAARYKQWAVLYSALGTLMATSLAPTLQNASLGLGTNHGPDGDRSFVRIDPIWSRLLTACLIVVAAFGILLFFRLRRKSGLLSDPRGIAGIAAMANKSHILMDFRDMDLAKHDEIHEKLKQRRYILYKSCLWQGEYITQSTHHVDPQKVKNPHPIMLRLHTGILFILAMLAFLAFIPVVIFTQANNITTTLPWLLTALATMIKLVWGALECDVRTIEPFYILSRRHAPSSVLTLDYTAAAYGYLPFRAFLNKNYLVALIGFGSVMTDVLTVCVSSFSVNGKEFVNAGVLDAGGTETFTSFWISLGLASTILIFLVISAALVYARRRHPFLPREPSTIASVLAFIHQSKMLYDFVDTETYNTDKMERHLRDKGKKYGLGWFRGRDGEDHCGVDEEPL